MAPVDPPSPPPSWRVNRVGWASRNPTDGGALLRHLTGDGSTRAVVGGVEAFVGFVTLLAVVFGGLGTLGGAVLFDAWAYHHPRVDRPTLAWLTVAWAVVLVAAARSAGFFLQALAEAGPPVPLGVARRWLGTTTMARPVVAAWWLTLALGVVAAAHAAAGHVAFVRPTAVERAIAVAVPVVVLYGSAVAANTSGLIAVAALTGSDAALRTAWRLRAAVDVLLVVGFVVVPPLELGQGF